MKIETFQLERTQSLWENTVDFNLTETGVHPLTADELLTEKEFQDIRGLRLGYGQTNGSIPLREAIAALYTGATRENVLVTTGSIEANLVAVWSLLERGDELIVVLPNYMQIWGLARAFDIAVKPFFLKHENQWQPDLDALRRLIGPNTRMIAVCHPNNPTGAVMTQATCDALIELARETDTWLYVEEIYRGAELTDRHTPSFYGTYEKTIVTGGLSKACALPGLRIGWLAGPAQVMADAWSRRDYTTIAPAILSDAMAVVALQPQKRLWIQQRNQARLRHNLAYLQRWVDGHGDLFHFIPPRAGGMAFLRYNLNIKADDLVERLRTEKSTLIVSGECFDMDRWIRIGIGVQPEELEGGLERFDEFLMGLP